MLAELRAARYSPGYPARSGVPSSGIARSPRGRGWAEVSGPFRGGDHERRARSASAFANGDLLSWRGSPPDDGPRLLVGVTRRRRSAPEVEPERARGLAPIEGDAGELVAPGDLFEE